MLERATILPASLTFPLGVPFVIKPTKPPVHVTTPICISLWPELSPSQYIYPTFSPPALGAAYGTAKSGTGIAAMSVMRPELIMKSIIPVVMAGIIAIYGLVVAVLIANNIADNITLYK